MKVAVAVHGTRGDIQPCAAVALELRRRGHEVSMAVPPNLVEFVESTGLAAVPYGPDSQKQLEADFFRKFWRLQNPVNLVRDGKEYITQGWADMSATLDELSGDAQLILTGTTYQEVAANVAEARGVPLAALHYFPLRSNGQIGFPHLALPSAVVRSSIRGAESLQRWMTSDAEAAQRTWLGLPPATGTLAQRMVRQGALEIQAYDEAWFPGLRDEWGSQRPFVGALTMEIDNADDSAVDKWIADGPAPIYFGFGSMPFESSEKLIGTIARACSRLGHRALVCTGSTAYRTAVDMPGLKIVGALNHSKVFPQCRAVVHHGGAGTTAAGLRAGRPTLIMWVGADAPFWANQVTRLKVGSAQRLSSITERSLVAQLHRILAPEYAIRAQQFSAQLTPPDVSLGRTADLLEQHALGRH